MAVASNTTLGDIKLAGDLAGNDNGLAPELSSTTVIPGSYVLPTLTVDAKGRLTEAADITQSELADLLPKASTSEYGIVQIGSGIDVAAGVISVPLASDTVAGRVKIDNQAIKIDGNGVLSFDESALLFASESVAGVVKIKSGGGINVTNGEISIPTPPLATTSSLGVVKIGANINVTNGEISVPVATSSSLGAIAVGTGLKVENGYLELDPAFAATSTDFGFVKLGGNIFNNNGQTDVNIGIASASTLGFIRVGAGLSIDGSGILSNDFASNPPLASSTVLGLVKIGTNVTVDGSGTISIPDATSTTKGILRVGSIGMQVSNGVISAKLASPTEYGVVRTSNTDDISTNLGIISPGSNIPRKNTQNVFTKAQVTSLVNLGNVSGNVTLDLNQGNVFYMTLTGNVTLQSPTNIINGGVYHIILQQDGTGNRTITFNSIFKFPGTVNYSTYANKRTVVSIVSVPNALLASAQQGF